MVHLISNASPWPKTSSYSPAAPTPCQICTAFPASCAIRFRTLTLTISGRAGTAGRSCLRLSSPPCIYIVISPTFVAVRQPCIVSISSCCPLYRQRVSILDSVRERAPSGHQRGPLQGRLLRCPHRQPALRAQSPARFIAVIMRIGMCKRRRMPPCLLGV